MQYPSRIADLLWKLAALAVLLFWPVVVFWQHIDFDPSRFTEEWVKTGVSGIILVLVLETLTRKHDSRAQKAHLVSLLQHRVRRPVDDLLEDLDVLCATLGVGKHPEAKTLARRIVQSTEVLARNIKGINLSETESAKQAELNEMFRSLDLSAVSEEAKAVIARSQIREEHLADLRVTVDELRSWQKTLLLFLIESW